MSISATRFKAKCLKLIDEVAATRKPLTITKRGKPLAKLVPDRLPASGYSDWSFQGSCAKLL